MKPYLFLVTIVLGITSHVHANEVCAAKAEIAANKFFDRYSDQAREQMQEQADENEEELDFDDLPGGFQQVSSRRLKNREFFSYTWSELQECLCGVEVTGSLSKNGKTCKSVKVDEDGLYCSCG